MIILGGRDKFSNLKENRIPEPGWRASPVHWTGLALQPGSGILFFPFFLSNLNKRLKYVGGRPQECLGWAMGSAMHSPMLKWSLPVLYLTYNFLKSEINILLLFKEQKNSKNTDLGIILKPLPAF